ncbi:ABC transporter [Colletotrichum tofieldiae]|nr:ABC transporter [Colletotrichum tofieldiae]
MYGIQRFYLRTSRQLRLLDLEAKAPLYTNFLDTIRGVATLRAFGWTDDAMRLNSSLVDTSQRPEYLLSMVQRWLSFVLGIVVAMIAVLVVTLSTQLRSNAGFAGASMVSIMSFGRTLANLVEKYTLLETSIGAVARLKSFSENTPRETLAGEVVVPPASWPERALVEIKGVSASYT